MDAMRCQELGGLTIAGRGPNAGGEPRPMAAATWERKLLGVGSRARFGVACPAVPHRGFPGPPPQILSAPPLGTWPSRTRVSASGAGWVCRVVAGCLETPGWPPGGAHQTPAQALGPYGAWGARHALRSLTTP